MNRYKDFYWNDTNYKRLFLLFTLFLVSLVYFTTDWATEEVKADYKSATSNLSSYQQQLADLQGL